LKLGGKSSHLAFFKGAPDLRSYTLNQNMIDVGGGNTKSMLAAGREWGVKKERPDTSAPPVKPGLAQPDRGSFPAFPWVDRISKRCRSSPFHFLTLR